MQSELNLFGELPAQAEIQFATFYKSRVRAALGKRTKSSDLRRAYLQWAETAGCGSISFIELRRLMERRGHRHLASNGIYYLDLELRTDQEAVEAQAVAGVSDADQAADLIAAALGVTVTQTLGKAQLGSAASAEVFSALGVSIRDAGGKFRTTSDILPDLADAIGRIPDPAKRAAVEVALFGRAGQKLDTLLEGGSNAIQTMAQRASSLGMVMSSELAQSADEAADRISELKLQLEANISVAVAQNADSILQLANAIAKMSSEPAPLCRGIA